MCVCVCVCVSRGPFPQQATKIESLQAEMKEMATNHEKNMKKKDSEVRQQLVGGRENWWNTDHHNIYSMY